MTRYREMLIRSLVSSREAQLRRASEGYGRASYAARDDVLVLVPRPLEV